MKGSGVMASTAGTESKANITSENSNIFAILGLRSMFFLLAAQLLAAGNLIVMLR